MRRNLLFLVATTSLFGAAPSFAQETVPTAAPYDWTGFYVGVFGGAALGNIDGESADADVTPTITSTGTNPTQALLLYDPQIDYGDFDIDDENFLGGFQAGYNIQAGNFVFGIVGDIMKTQIKGSESFPYDGSEPALLVLEEGECAYVGSCGEVSAELEWLATLQAKFGYATGQILFFVKGGAAWGEIEADVAVPVRRVVEFDAPSSELVVPINACDYILSCDEDSGTAFGYTLGIGMAARLTQHMFAEIGYSYVDLGETDLDFDFDEIVEMSEGSAEADFSAHLLRFGLNWQF